MTVSDSGTPMIMGGDGFGCGGGFIWAFLIFALLMGNGGFGGFGGNGNGNANAIQADVNRGFDNQNLQSQTRDILTAVNNGTAQSVAASNQVFHDLSNNLSDKYSELARDVAGVNASIAQAIANQNECCCSQKMLIAETGAGINANLAQNRFDAAMNTAAINATTTAQTQKILDAISQNKIEALQGKVNQLELQSALAGVVRYPMQTTYGAGPSPFCNCGYGYPVYAG
jgi:hypothetical protein